MRRKSFKYEIHYAFEPPLFTFHHRISNTLARKIGRKSGWQWRVVMKFKIPRFLVSLLASTSLSRDKRQKHWLSEVINKLHDELHSTTNFLFHSIKSEGTEGRSRVKCWFCVAHSGSSLSIIFSAKKGGFKNRQVKVMGYLLQAGWNRRFSKWECEPSYR